MLEVVQIPVLNDNYIYLLKDEESGKVAVVDPALAQPVENELERRGWQLDFIYNTHHHADHVGGNLQLKQKFGCKVIGSRQDQKRIPGADILVGQDNNVALGSSIATVIETPGHTSAHIVYWFSEAEALFCGDTLFSLGCGRLFEGTAAQMWDSLQKIKALPDATKVYCAHEYTQANSAFCMHLEPGNSRLKNFVEGITRKRQQGRPTVPSPLGDEKSFNPFLRVDDNEFTASIKASDLKPAEVFASIRLQKDGF